MRLGLAIFLCASATALAQPAPVLTQSPVAPNAVFQYEGHWRFWRAGTARLTLPSSSGDSTAQNRALLHLETSGFVGKLYRVDDTYTTTFDSNYCTSQTVMEENEKKRRRLTSVTFQQPVGKAVRIDRDLNAGGAENRRKIDVPSCVHDVIAALAKLRHMGWKTGEAFHLPISDGKKSAQVRVEVGGEEAVKTPAGEFKATRFEVLIFNDVIYRRKGRLMLWVTRDERRWPVQMRIDLPFYIGNVTVGLVKVDQDAQTSDSREKH